MEQMKTKSDPVSVSEEEPPSAKTISDSIQPTIFAMWLNKKNSCWLDASLAVIAHNKTMRRLAYEHTQNKIYDILLAYDKASILMNSGLGNSEQRLKEARMVLHAERRSVRHFLQPKLKCGSGEPDSAFCSLLNIIMEDESYQKHFEVTWLWVQKCAYCKENRSWQRTKPIITISRANEFEPELPTCLYRCSCSDVDQKMELVYIEMPPCLIFHFESGVKGEDKDLTVSFFYQNAQFELTSIVTLQKPREDDKPDHFITWARNPDTEQWLECNDLNPDAASFSPNPPCATHEEIYMLVYEADYNGKKICSGPENPGLPSSNFNIPCIDISDESDSSEDMSNESILVNGNDSDTLGSSGSGTHDNDLPESSGSLSDKEDDW